MAEKQSLHEEMLERVVAYYAGDLAPAERAEFEAHLATCKKCQHALRLSQMALPVAEDMLVFKPKLTIDEQVARFEAMWAEKDRVESRLRRTRPAPSRLWLGIAVAMTVVVVATFLTFLLWRLIPTITERGQEVYAPEPPHAVDGGTRP